MPNDEESKLTSSGIVYTIERETALDYQLETEEDDDAAAYAHVMDAKLDQLLASGRYRGRKADINAAQATANAAWEVVVKTSAALRVARGDEEI